MDKDNTKLRPTDKVALSSNLRPIHPRSREIFKISGMTCQGCRAHVEQILKNVRGVKHVQVDLHKHEAEVEFSQGGNLQLLKQALQEEGGAYSIHALDEKIIPRKKKRQSHSTSSGAYYCPMRCEGDKTYDKPGFCPICGMDLVPQLTSSDHSAVDASLVRKFWIALIFTLPIFVISMSEMIPGNPIYGNFSPQLLNITQMILSLPVIFYSGWMCFQRAWQSFKSFRYNMFTLIGIGVGAAWIFSVVAICFPSIFPDEFISHHNTVHVYFEAATVILTLVLLGQWLEAKAHSKTQDAVKTLLGLMPTKAYKVTNDGVKEINVNDIQPGDLLSVRPGDKVPADGVMEEGQTDIDESMITGEPIPVDKQKGDRVSSGTINGSGSFVFRVIKTGEETLLSQIVEMVSKAGSSHAPVQKLSDKIASYFVPIVVCIALVTFVIWAMSGTPHAFTYAFVNAVAVLIIACPCALGLATPMSMMVGIGRGATEGILIKNGEALQKMAEIDTLVTDKTGTLTEGKPFVQEIKYVAQEKKDLSNSLLHILSESANHPLSKAIVAYTKTQSVSCIKVDHFQNKTGKGVQALLREEDMSTPVFLGNTLFMQEHQIHISDTLQKEIDDYRQEGATISFLALGGELLAYVVIADKIKPNVRSTIENMNRSGVDVVMLTGDSRLAASHLAARVGITHYQAELLPDKKWIEIQKLQQQGRVVAMLGDGINDAPALAQSDVGIAMETGADVAIDSAKIILLHGDIAKVRKTYALSKSTMSNIRSNLIFALVYNMIGIPVAAGVLYPLWGILLSPMLAAVAMSLSSVSVICNALRLRRIHL